MKFRKLKLYYIKNIPYYIKKYCYCRFVHRNHLCYPEVWDRGLDGPWHCSKCHPCGEMLDELLKMAENMKKKESKKDGFER